MRYLCLQFLSKNNIRTFAQIFFAGVGASLSDIQFAAKQVSPTPVDVHAANAVTSFCLLKWKPSGFGDVGHTLTQAYPEIPKSAPVKIPRNEPGHFDATIAVV